jgi:hypothetical protein
MAVQSNTHIHGPYNGIASRCWVLSVAICTYVVLLVSKGDGPDGMYTSLITDTSEDAKRGSMRHEVPR